MPQSDPRRRAPSPTPGAIRGLGLLACCLLLLGCSNAGPPAPVASPDEPAPPGRPDAGVFADVTASSGLNFTYRNGEEADHYTVLESLGGGVALLDYDGDGLLDI